MFFDTGLSQAVIRNIATEHPELMLHLELKLYAFSYLLLATSSVHVIDLGGLTLRSVDQWDSDLALCGLWKKPRRAEGNHRQENTDQHQLSPQQGEHDTAAHDGDSEAGVWVSPAIALSRRPGGGGIRLSTTRDVAAAETLYTVPSAFHFKAAKLYDEEDPDDAELAKAMSQILLEHKDVEGIRNMNRGAALGEEDLLQVLWLFFRLVRVRAAPPSSPDPSTTATTAFPPSTMSCSSLDSRTAGVMSAVCNGTTSTDDDTASTVISTDEDSSPGPRTSTPLRRITQLASNIEAHLRLYLHSEGG